MAWLMVFDSLDDGLMMPWWGRLRMFEEGLMVFFGDRMMSRFSELLQPIADNKVAAPAFTTGESWACCRHFYMVDVFLNYRHPF